MIYKVKIADPTRYEVVPKRLKKPCKQCGGVGHFGTLMDSPSLIVFCNCVVLRQISEEEYARRLKARAEKSSNS